jgi:sensor domain CHASE-containing protein
MSLGRKIGLSILALVIVSIMLTYGILRLVILPSYVALEKEEAKKDVGRVLKALDREIYHLYRFARDWASWDDTYRFVQDQNPLFVDSNLVTETFVHSDINAIYICNSRGEVLWGEVVDTETSKRVKMTNLLSHHFPANHALLQHKTVDSHVKGILLTEKVPCLSLHVPLPRVTRKGQYEAL